MFFLCAFYPGWRTPEKLSKRVGVLTLGYSHVTPTEFSVWLGAGRRMLDWLPKPATSLLPETGRSLRE
jgi:hypothetical protein